MSKNLILITGPCASGKTSLAEYISGELGYVRVSEDMYWGELTKDRVDYDGHRTADEEILIRDQVISDVSALLLGGRDIALEFLMYHNPPLPLMTYIEAFAGIAAEIKIAVLNPTADATFARKVTRGRENELDTSLDGEVTNIINWRKCLNTPHIDPKWVIDNADLTIPETFNIIRGE